MDGHIVLNHALRFPNYHRQMQSYSQVIFHKYKLYHKHFNSNITTEKENLKIILSRDAI